MNALFLVFRFSSLQKEGNAEGGRGGVISPLYAEALLSFFYCVFFLYRYSLMFHYERSLSFALRCFYVLVYWLVSPASGVLAVLTFSHLISCGST